MFSQQAEIRTWIVASLLSQLSVRGTYQDTVMNCLHACEIYCDKGQPPAPHVHNPPTFLSCSFTSAGCGGQSRVRESYMCWYYPSIHRSVEESTGSRAGGLWGQVGYQTAQIWRRTLPSTHKNCVSLPIIIVLFSCSVFFISLLDRLLIWNPFYSLEFTQKCNF